MLKVPSPHAPLPVPSAALRRWSPVPCSIHSLNRRPGSPETPPNSTGTPEARNSNACTTDPPFGSRTDGFQPPTASKASSSCCRGHCSSGGPFNGLHEMVGRATKTSIHESCLQMVWHWQQSLSTPRHQELKNREGEIFSLGLFRGGNFVSQMGREITHAKSAASAGEGRSLLIGGYRCSCRQLVC